MEILLDAWSDEPPARRAAMIAAQGDMMRAGACADGWRQLASGDTAGALRVARADEDRGPDKAYLEAETLIAAGMVVAGLKRLEALHGERYAPATLALARRRHNLGDHGGAQRAAMQLPMHPQAALTGARSALADHRVEVAARFLEPYLEGLAPIPEPAVAGAVAVVAASVLARNGQFEWLRRFAAGVIGAGDLPEDMMPMAARTAWIAGLAGEAWERFKGDDNPWQTAARVELALLAGNTPLAAQLLKRAGPVAAPAAATLMLVRGTPGELPSDEAKKAFVQGAAVHVWRTHPHRWQPWIDAALATDADVGVFDLATDDLPDSEAVPHAVVDDGSLLGMLTPVPVPAGPPQGNGVWIQPPLCEGVGIGHDWPDEETRSAKERLSPAETPGTAAVWVLDAETALAHASEGHPMVVVAPPGDPFWAGPFPERAWPAMRIVRTDPQDGWRGAGARVAELANGLLGTRVERGAGDAGGGRNGGGRGSAPTPGRAGA